MCLCSTVNKELKHVRELLDSAKQEQDKLHSKMNQCLEDNAQLKSQVAELQTTVNGLKHKSVADHAAEPSVLSTEQASEDNTVTEPDGPEDGEFSDNNSDNTKDSQSDSNDRDFATNTGRRFGDPKRRGAEVILIRDSIGKFVNPRRFFGNKQACVINTSTAQNTKSVLPNWESSSDVETFIVHQGINDLKNGHSVEHVASDLQSVLRSAQDKYKNAKVAFSEVLHAGGADNKELNQKITEVNREMEDFCLKSDRYVYIRHETLQSNNSCFMDDFHINDGSGTALFVADMSHAVRGTAPRRGKGGTTRAYDNRRTPNHSRDMDFQHSRNREFVNSRAFEDKHSGDRDRCSRDMEFSESRDVWANSIQPLHLVSLTLDQILVRQ